MIECEAKAAIPTEKHIELSRAISEIENISARAEALLNKICGTPGKEEGCDSSTIPSLSSVLNGGAGEIRETVNNALSFLERIEQELF